MMRRAAIVLYLCVCVCTWGFDMEMPPLKQLWDLLLVVASKWQPHSCGMTSGKCNEHQGIQQYLQNNEKQASH